MRKLLLHIIDGTVTNEAGTKIGTVTADQGLLTFKAPEATVTTDTWTAMTWELAGVYGAQAELAP